MRRGPAAWRGKARCLAGSLAAFYAEDTRQAKAFCALCPVWQQCLEKGLEETHGVWGGLGRRERLRLGRLRARLATAPGDPQNAADVRRLVAAGLAPERLAVAAGIELEAITACLVAKPRRRRSGQPTRAVRAAGAR